MFSFFKIKLLFKFDPKLTPTIEYVIDVFFFLGILTLKVWTLGFGEDE